MRKLKLESTPEKRESLDLEKTDNNPTLQTPIGYQVQDCRAGDLFIASQWSFRQQ